MGAKKGSVFATTAPYRDPLLSTLVGGFLVQKRLGFGSLGTVYLAANPATGREVAIKVFREDAVSPRRLERFLTEARALNALGHPGILQVLGSGKVAEDQPYIIMELLRGFPLWQVLRWQGRLDLPTAAGILDQVLYVLEAVHGAGVVHRDLKPLSVHLDQGPDGMHSVKLVDLGSLKEVWAEDVPEGCHGILRARAVDLTPEQIRGEAVSPATDLHAVGALAVQLLTGERAFVGDSDYDMLVAIREEPPALPSSRVPELPRELDALVLRLMAKEPGQRPESARAVREALRRIPGTALPELPAPRAGAWPPMARFAPFEKPPSKPPPLPPPPERRSWVGWAVALTLLVWWGAYSVVSCSREEAPVASARPETAPSPAAQERARLRSLQSAQTDEIDLARLALRDREDRVPDSAKAHEALGNLRLRASRAVTDAEREAIRQELGEWKRVYLGSGAAVDTGETE